MWLKAISLFLSGFGLGMAITNFIWYNASMKEMERREQQRQEVIAAELLTRNKAAQERHERWQRIYNQIDGRHQDSDDRQDV